MCASVCIEFKICVKYLYFVRMIEIIIVSEFMVSSALNYLKNFGFLNEVNFGLYNFRLQLQY